MMIPASNASDSDLDSGNQDFADGYESVDSEASFSEDQKTDSMEVEDLSSNSSCSSSSSGADVDMHRRKYQGYNV